MLSQVEREASTVWLQEPALGGWIDDIGQLPPIGAVSKHFATDGLLDKVNDDKLARDVEDLSAIFEELEGGVVDFPLPCDDEEVATGAEVTGDWIGDLENDVVNVDELSSMFDALAAEQATAMETVAETSSDDDDEEEAVYDSDESYDDDMEGDDQTAARAINVQIIPAPPTWATSAPLDPRSVIRTPVFKNLDSRIPRVEIPRMDFACGPPAFTMKPASAVPGLRPTSALSPKPCSKKTAESAKEPQYLHDPASCWICKSDKSPYKKYALHRYLEKRHRRNWKRGPRYSGRSNVATNRVREGGRFITTAHWV